MDSYEMIVALSGQICGTVAVLTLAALWFRRRKGVPELPRDVMQRIDLRLTEMQQSLDAVALEVERISEGQRFTTKLLAERGIAAGEGPNAIGEALRSPGR
jgi:hypothetical protein